MMKLTILGNEYSVVDSKEKITIADSFVVRQNKIGGGNGEKKLYIGNENNFNREFFGISGFIIKCFLLKKDLVKYLVDTKEEYLNPQQPYQQINTLSTLWSQRNQNIDSLSDKIEFEVSEKVKIRGPRLYVNSNDRNYNLLRELSIPNISFVSIVKLISKSGTIEYYFKLFADYFGEKEHPSHIQKTYEIIDSIESKTEREALRNARLGHGKYRKDLLKLCPFCPITSISDDRLLTASHIKPWSESDDKEKIDPYNGFMFTPTIDRLFDRGYISFKDNKKIMLSPFISKMTYSKLNLRDDKTIHLLPIDDREKYLAYHRKVIFEG